MDSNSRIARLFPAVPPLIMGSYSDWVPPRTTDELDDFVDLIVDGQCPLDPPLQELLDTSLGHWSFDFRLKAAYNNKKRVDVISQFFPYTQFQKILASFDKVLLKSDPVRNILEVKGDVFLNIGNKEKAVRCYTLALSFALTDMAGIYMKRATLFVNMEKYELALMDVEVGLRHDDRESKAHKVALLELKKACEALMLPKVEDEEDLKREEYRSQVISKVQGENLSPLKGLSEIISVQYHAKKGRYLVTNIDLEPGSTVLVEEAFVTATVDQLTWQAKHCDRCLKETSNPIPCEGCVYYIYCGEECRSEDQNHGHKYECPILPYMHCMMIPSHFHMCFKAVCKIGPDVLKELWIKSKSVDRGQNPSWLVPPDATHGDRDTYSQVLNMISHDRSFDLPVSGWLAVSLAYAIRIKTTFFDKIDESDVLEFEQFIATMILNHSESFPVNGVGLNNTGIEVKSVESHLEVGEGDLDVQVASGIYPLLSLLNHSCTPSTFRQRLPGGKLVVVTNQQLKAGEELSMSYGPEFLNLSKNERNIELSEYNFVCDCIACREDWPLFEEMEDLEYIGSPSGVQSRSSALLILARADEMLLTNRPLEAIPFLKKCIAYFQKDSSQPSKNLIRAQTRLMDSYDIILNKVILAKEVLNKEEPKVERKACTMI